MIPGSVLVHQQMKFASFNCLASVLIYENNKLRYVQAFEMDCDTNLSVTSNSRTLHANTDWQFDKSHP